jgi:hydrogenase nickel incorporation protein HypB
MCTTCGCGEGETRIEGEGGHAHEHRHADGTVHSHPHVHEGEHAHSHGHVHVHTHPDGSVHEHWHEHDGEHAHHHEGHAHEHVHADGTTHSHPHEHEGEHRHAHPETHTHVHADGTVHTHSHEQAGEHVHEGRDHMHFGTGPAGAHAPGLSQSRMVQIEQDILAKNDGYAARNREWLADRGIFALNLVSSPGSGKTTLLVKTIEALRSAIELTVIEGDQQTTHDADRVRATGVRAIQINTGKGCHLDAHMVGRALERLAPPDDSVLMIENVGNLVCPSSFDLGEAHKVVVLSVTEGEDKPLKYPDMFHAARLMLLNKIDLLPYLDFDVEACLANARRVNPKMAILPISARTGQGMDDWLAWIAQGAQKAQADKVSTVEALRRRIADLQAELAHLRSQ